MSSICAVPECERELVGQGYCMKHYVQFRRTGTPYRRKDPRYGTTPIPPSPRTVTPSWAGIEEKFWALVTKTEDCWVWNGPRREDGAPMLPWGGGRIAAHRYAWDLHHPEDTLTRMFVVQWTCAGGCVNPEHLVKRYIGDVQKEARARKEAAS